MKIILIFVVAIAIIKMGFSIMKKIDIYRKEQNRQRGLPVDEED